jgi:glucan 1,3-beta-glucosidase
VPQGGAILIEYNLKTDAGSGLWDVHTRVGGFAGSNLQVSQCIKNPGDATIQEECIAAFMSLHITKSASGFYGENNWLWVADHDIEDPNLTQITVYAGRGLLIESEAGNNILWGSAGQYINGPSISEPRLHLIVEHHVLYEYALLNTAKITLGQLQTETAYYQPIPAAPLPFPLDATYDDPDVGVDGWGLYIKNSDSVKILGAGLYSFFNNYDVHCSDQGNTSKCQSQILNVVNSEVEIYNLNTVGTQSMISVDGTSIAEWSDNKDGFVSTIALFQITASSKV